MSEGTEITRLYREAKSRAKRRGTTFKLTRAMVARLWATQGGACALTAMPFDMSPRSPEWRPYCASLDRIDSDRGYEPGNVRLIVASMNVALNRWGESVFETNAVNYLNWKEFRRREAKRSLTQSGQENAHNASLETPT